MSELTLQQAETILRDADGAGFLQGGIPETEAEKINKATRTVNNARAAKRAGIKHPVVSQIIAVADGEQIGDTVPWEETAAEVKKLVDEPKAEVDDDISHLQDLPEDTAVAEEPPKKRRSKKERGSTQVEPAPPVPTPASHVDETVPENLPIPLAIDGPSMPLPADFTKLSDEEVRRLHSTYHAYHSRAAYLLSQEEAQLSRAGTAHQAAYNRVLAGDGDEAKVTVRKAQATADPEVAEWAEKMRQHNDKVRTLKMLRDYYETTCTRLSREFTMRSGERDSA